ncbi:MAG: carbon storage regulator [Planctomycetaceae bacterium]|nr:carbon storage regulator [Planctomycetaceae bacterium]
MLVLTRKQAETIHIGDDIVIKVIQTGRGSIKIGVEAPGAVRVLRGEVVEEAAKHSATSQAQVSTRVVRPTKPAKKAGETIRFGAV